MGAVISIASKLLANPVASKLVAKVFDKVFGDPKPTMDKVSSPAGIGVVVGIIVSVVAFIDPGLGEILQAHGINGLVLGVYSLVLAIFAYYTPETKA